MKARDLSNHIYPKEERMTDKIDSLNFSYNDLI